MSFLNKAKRKVSFSPYTAKGKTQLHRKLNGEDITQFLENIELKDIYPKSLIQLWCLVVKLYLIKVNYYFNK